jgi:hypothetical protein
MIGDFDMPIRRHDVHNSGHQRLLVRDRENRQGAVSGQNLAKMAGIGRIKVLGQYDRRRKIGGQSGDQSREGLNTAG